MKLTNFQKEALHGVMLGDGHLAKRSKTSTPHYTQTFGQKAGIFASHIYGLFLGFCSPRGFYTYMVQSGKNSPFYQRWIVSTLVSTEFQPFVDLYYTFNTLGKRIKILPKNIKDIISPVTLAYLVMSDGNIHKTHGIIRLCTNNFTKSEVQLIADAIYSRYKIECRLEHVRKQQYIIVIRKSEVPKFQAIVKAHIIPTLMYRIGL